MIVSRVDDSQIRTLHNVCRHRGTLISREDCGKARRLVCPYHQWTYERDGKLASCRGMHDEINQDELGLLLAHLEDLEGMLFVSLAETPVRAQELTDLIEMGRSIDFDIRPIAIDELAERMPHMRTDDLTEACWCPTDDHLQPAELAGAFHKVGRDHGVRYETNCPVTEVLLEGNQARGVQTPKGESHAPILVNAAGPWSHLVAGLTDTTLPTAALGHVYPTTQPHPDHPVDRLSPGFRNRHHRIYGRPENGGLLVGIYGEDYAEFDMSTLPEDFDMSSMKARRDDIHVAMLINAAQQSFPWLNERTPMHVTHGIMTFTPDGLPFCGQLPDHEGLFYCTGFSGHGIVQSPVIGVIMSELILDGQSTYDIASIEADRYWEVPSFQERAEIQQRCYKMQGSYYARVNGITEAPRALLPDNLKEMPRHSCQTACCGAGGGRMWFDDPIEERIGTSRITEALDTGAKTVAFSCPFCLTMMTDGLAAKDDSVQVCYIAELMAEENLNQP